MSCRGPVYHLFCSAICWCYGSGRMSNANQLTSSSNLAILCFHALHFSPGVKQSRYCLWIVMRAFTTTPRYLRWALIRLHGICVCKYVYVQISINIDFGAIHDDNDAYIWELPDPVKRYRLMSANFQVRTYMRFACILISADWWTVTNYWITPVERKSALWDKLRLNHNSWLYNIHLCKSTKCWNFF